MGEHKLPKTPPPPVKRPSASILGMRSSVAGWKSGVMGVSDEDTNDFMKDLEKILAWIDELEAATDPFAKVVPFIDPVLADEAPLPLQLGHGHTHDLTAGHFRRLNPNAAKPPLAS